MPKRNAILMVVLAVAVIAATGFLALRPAPSPEAGPARIELLLRKLGDADSDVRREGETGLRKMGNAATGPLTQASKSADRVLAGRAAQLLRETAPTVSIRTEIRSEEILLEVSSSRVSEEESGARVYGALLINRSSAPVLVALPGEASAWSAAWFEVEDDQGRSTRVEASPEGAVATAGSVVSVAPGKTLIFASWNQSPKAPPPSKTRGVRFVYDASHPAYRLMTEKADGGALLPSMKLASKTLVLADAR
jgi:hypothetical protein